MLILLSCDVNAAIIAEIVVASHAVHLITPINAFNWSETCWTFFNISLILQSIFISARSTQMWDQSTTKAQLCGACFTCAQVCFWILFIYYGVTVGFNAPPSIISCLHDPLRVFLAEELIKIRFIKSLHICMEKFRAATLQTHDFHYVSIVQVCSDMSSCTINAKLAATLQLSLLILKL